MTKAEMEQKLQEQQTYIDNHRKKVREQNIKAKENWETVSCRLPKGTKQRITSKGLKTNGLINRLVLAELDRLEKLPQNASEAPESPGTQTADKVTAQAEKPQKKPVSMFDYHSPVIDAIRNEPEFDYDKFVERWRKPKKTEPEPPDIDDPDELPFR